MQADNAVAYRYVLCNVQCTGTARTLDVTSLEEYTRAHIAQVASMPGAHYNCYVASSLESARAAAQAMVHENPLIVTERVALCKIKQKSAAHDPPAVSLQPVPSTGLLGVSVNGPARSYAYVVHRHAQSNDRVTLLSSAAGADVQVALQGLDGPYFARSMDEARTTASRLEPSNSVAVVISRIESSTTASVPCATTTTALESVPIGGLVADNGRRYVYVVLRCRVQPDGRLDVSTTNASAIVQADAHSHLGGRILHRNLTFVQNDYTSLQKAVQQEQVRVPLTQAQRLLVCKIKYVSQVSSGAPPPTALRTDSKSYRYMVQRHDATANGVLEMQVTNGEHWSRLRGDGMYMAETADEANRIVAQQCAAEPRAANQLWLVSRVECVGQRPALVFTAV